MWAESDGEGRGATLVVDLPLPTDDVRSAPKPAAVYRKLESAPSRLINLAGRRILVVDGEPDARDLLAEILSQAGADVVVVGSADEALDALARWRPDVLVSDIGMPGDDGYVLIRKVRALSAGQGGRVRGARARGWIPRAHRQARRSPRADRAHRRPGAGAARLRAAGS